MTAVVHRIAQWNAIADGIQPGGVNYIFPPPDGEMYPEAQRALEVVGLPTLREHDGLAMSSRNRRLTFKERAFAPCLYKALLTAQESIACGKRNSAAIKAQAARVL
jgi:pantothenate synthetase